ncbi:MAG: hypothetical protein M0Q38_10860 [Bacteroidales bacterium]|nr:hypothetical protein [Bacteroidales bacterium]
MNDKPLKKIIIFLFSIILILVVAGCKKQTSYEQEMRAYYIGLCEEQQLELKERIAVANGDLSGARKIKAENEKIRQAYFQSLDRARSIYDGSANRTQELYAYIIKKNKLEIESRCKEKLTVLEEELSGLEKSGKAGFTLEQKSFIESNRSEESGSISGAAQQRSGDSINGFQKEYENK